MFVDFHRQISLMRRGQHAALPVKAGAKVHYKKVFAFIGGTISTSLVICLVNQGLSPRVEGFLEALPPSRGFCVRNSH